MLDLEGNKDLLDGIVNLSADFGPGGLPFVLLIKLLFKVKVPDVSELDTL